MANIDGPLSGTYTAKKSGTQEQISEVFIIFRFLMDQARSMIL